MPDSRNPFDASVRGTVTLGNSEAKEKEIITGLVQDGIRADQEREGWLERQRVLSRLRYGLRKIKTFPWPGASNLSIPFIDVAIRKMKPLFMRLLTEADPVVEFVGQDPAAFEQERRAEEVYHWLFHTEMSAVEPMAYVIDTMAHRGFAFAEVGWNYRTEFECRVARVADLFPQGIPEDPNQIAQVFIQQYELDTADSRVQQRLQQAIEAVQNGAAWVKIAQRKIIRDEPAIWDRDPVQVIAPPRTTDFENAEWIIIQHVLPIRKLEQMEADGFFDRGTVAQINSILEENRDAGTQSGLGSRGFPGGGLDRDKQIQDERERIFGIEDEDNVLVWRVYHWADIDNDGLSDRVETWIHPRGNLKLASRPYIYPFHQWPIVKFDFEKTNRRWHSPRGISGMLEGLQREINAQHNARLDGMTLRNAPTYVVSAAAGFKARNFRVVPGTIMEVQGQIQPLVQDRGPWGEQVNEENLLRQIGEQYIGTLDPVISGQGNEARTATEIQAAVQNASATASLDAILFQASMRKLHTLVWELFMDLGPSEIFVRVLGEDPEQAGPAPIRVQKSEINRRFKLIPTGTIANTNRALEMALAREALSLYLQDQSGFVNPFELRRWHLNLLDYRRARRILNSPNQAQEQVILRQAAEALSQNPELQQQVFGGPAGEAPEEPEADTTPIQPTVSAR